MRIDQRHPDKPDHLILSCRGSTGVLEIGDVGTSLTVITAPEGTNMDVFQFVCASAESLPRKGQGWKVCCLACQVQMLIRAALWSRVLGNQAECALAADTVR